MGNPLPTRQVDVLRNNCARFPGTAQSLRTQAPETANKARFTLMAQMLQTRAFPA
jgi:hypothetical protein